MLFKWIPNFVPRKIFIFGCGGTGSRVVPLVSQFIKSCPWVVNPEIHLFDFDEIETKNLLRQNFISNDVGKNKAVVLANRYSKAFNINITPHVHRLTKNPRTTDERLLLDEVNNIIYQDSRGNNIFILCVDTPEARREIVSAILTLTASSYNNLILDAGNENDFGQVTLSSTHGMDITSYIPELRDDTPIQCTLPYIPIDSRYYDDMVANSTPSCADLDQTMAINTLMAVNIFSVIQNVYYVKPISFFRMNISMQHGAVPEYINTNYFGKLARTLNDGHIGRNVYKNSLRSVMAKAYSEQQEFDEEMRVVATKVEVLTEINGDGRPVKKTRMKKATVTTDSVDTDSTPVEVTPIVVNVGEPALSTIGQTTLRADSLRADSLALNFNLGAVDTMIARVVNT